MPDRHPSAIKRNRQNAKRRERNRSVLSRVRTQIRKANETIAKQDAAAADTELRQTARELAKAQSKGVLHKNAVSRRVARMSRKVHQLKSTAG